ncbi:serine/threonine-protein kinase ATM [Apium graveolens]|uniref:serine/threonine-protein kinase ATM n=1 Tax=Apium graveolens TaxID=4045 RepID=UPI003D7B4228
MEILESVKALVENTVMSNMANEQNPCGERVDGGSGLVSGDKLVVGSDEVVLGGIVGNQGLGGEGIAGGGEGGVSVGDKGDCWGFGDMERGVLDNEGVAGGNEGKECGLGPDFVESVGYGFDNGSGFMVVHEVSLSDIGIEEVGDDMLVMHEAGIQEAGAEKVVMQVGTQEVGAEKVVMQENIQEVGAEKVVIQEGIEEVRDEDVVMQEGIVEIEAGDVVMQETIEAEEVGAEKVVMQEGFEVVGAEKVLMQEDAVGDEELMQEVNEEVKDEEVLQKADAVVGAEKLETQEDMVGDEELMQEVNEEVLQKADGEVGAAKVVMQEGIKEQYVSQQNLADYGNKIDVSKSGISLYVDVFDQVDSGVHGDPSCMVELGSIETSALLPDNGTEGRTAVQNCGRYKDTEEGNYVEGEAIACDGQIFNVGDLVWTKTNTQLWWPGMIFDHSDLSNVTLKGGDDRFQVKLFGSGNMLWGRTSQLKPFHDYFEQMSRQSISKSFFCAVEKAVGEIGRRAKLELTCPCYAEESKNTDLAERGDQISKERGCKLDELLVLQFEPEKLLARIKCFARDVAVSGIIESKIIQNRLSAFYQSIGHLQLPIHQLKPTDARSDDQNQVTSEVISIKQTSKSRTRSSLRDSEDSKNEAIGTVVSSEMKTPSPILSTKVPSNEVNSVDRVGGTNGKLEKSYESRERRKSKYLSFPYVDPAQLPKGLNNEEANEMADPSDDNFRSARIVNSRDKKTKKNPCRKSTGYDITVPEVINASSAELLSKLRFTAVDCLYPDESKQFDIMQCFVSTFRKFAFRDFTHEVTKEENTVCMDFEDVVGLYKSVSEIAVKKTAGIGSVEKDTKIKSTPKCRKKENTTPLGFNTKPTDGFPGNITTSGSIVIDFQTDPNASESQTVSVKKTKKAKKTPGFPDIKVMARLPDLKGSNVGAQLTSGNYSLTNGVVLPSENGTIEAVGAGLKEVQVLGPCSLQNVPGLNMQGTKESDASKNTGPGLVTKGVPELKKRKRKQKAANVVSAIPDLNGNTTETYPSEMKCIPPEVKPQRKSRKKKVDAGLLDINLSSGEAHTNGETLGTALLLKFAPEAPMPTPEDLMSAFCIFGALKDSEAKVFNEFGTAQVVFINSSDARTAFCSLEKNSPFGPALVNYRLQVLFAASGVSGPDGGLNMHQVWPAEKSPPKPRTTKKPKNLAKPSTISDPQGQRTEAPDLQFVRQNLQMMTSMLENAGDNISQEMRVKLETEIKSLLNRVTSMVGGSSSL